MTIQDALKIVDENIHNKNLKKHMIAVAGIMKALAEKLGEDAEKWEIAGLLHDIDYEKTEGSLERHGLVSAEMLKGKIPEDSIHAIKAHNFERTKVEPETKMDNALIAADAVSGLIVATALVMPSKKLEEVKEKSVEKKFGDNSFARNIDRKRILFCEKIGLTKKEFLDLSLKALQGISRELGL